MVIYKKITTVNINVSTVVTVTMVGVAEVMKPKLSWPGLAVVLPEVVVSFEGDSQVPLIITSFDLYQDINIGR